MHLTKPFSILAATACLMLAQPALAQDPKPAATPAPSARALELARRYVAASHMDRLMNQSMEAMTPAMMAEMDKVADRLTPEQRKTVNQIVIDTVKDFTQKSVTKLQARMPLILAETFTETELQDLTTFYESPTGQAVLTKMPVMMAKVMPMMMEDMPQLQADIVTRLCAAYPTECRLDAPKGKSSSAS